MRYAQTDLRRLLSNTSSKRAADWEREILSYLDGDKRLGSHHRGGGA